MNKGEEEIEGDKAIKEDAGRDHRGMCREHSAV